jgi:hypothetical protein
LLFIEASGSMPLLPRHRFKLLFFYRIPTQLATDNDNKKGALLNE